MTKPTVLTPEPLFKRAVLELTSPISHVGEPIHP